MVIEEIVQRLRSNSPHPVDRDLDHGSKRNASVRVSGLTRLDLFLSFHHLLAFAAIALVEGGTMAAESAVLGTPAVCLQSYNFGYLVALEKQYGLIARAGSVAAALPIAEGLLELPDLRQQWRQKRDRLLAESEDVTEFQLRMIERAAAEHPVKWKAK